MTHRQGPEGSANRKASATGRSSFDVLVLATMSAGKTSFVNALIGTELLHTANEATTACITSVEHRQGARDFSGACYSYENQELACLQNIAPSHIRNWNANSDVKRITLNGSFRTSPSPAQGLVLHDTPGPNNSQDTHHAQLMLEAVRTVPFQALCYVLNASQLGTQDDHAVLTQLRSELAFRPNRSIYFILNKVDLLDPEKGEGIDAYVNNSHRYLTGIGFERPVIIPTMASVALYARMVLNHHTLTRVQRLKLRQTLIEFSEDKSALLRTAVVPDPIKKGMLKTLATLERQRNARLLAGKCCEKNDLQQLLTISGLKTIEALIKHQRQSIKNP
ncbi:dynamin family protein [Pseudomonas duriflava]|uniref:Dynamin family protein n=1 Tax=Pseudomonas duriflava TaxID=459528 RepID=A0A562PYX7_9PSED|nr:dynamin family protein [Pseudomonas duriflava]TWI49619.1 dynamin family protein [Pseudomonas duriflava]